MDSRQDAALCRLDNLGLQLFFQIGIRMDLGLRYLVPDGACDSRQLLGFVSELIPDLLIASTPRLMPDVSAAGSIETKFETLSRTPVTFLNVESSARCSSIGIDRRSLLTSCTDSSDGFRPSRTYRSKARINSSRIQATIVFHSLRHTFGTRMASAGAPLVAIKEWMGHADIQTTMIYAKWAKDREAERALVDAAFVNRS
jgi:hypothetical protein